MAPIPLPGGALCSDLIAATGQALPVTALVIGTLGSALVECLLRPRPRPVWRRGAGPVLIHLASWVTLFGLALLLVQRPGFACLLLLSLQLVVVQVSNVKSRTLNEPFFFHDLEYFLDAILHPRLYVPFFGIRLAIAASSAGAIAIAACLWLEPSLIRTHGLGAWLLTSLALVTLGTGTLILADRHLPGITLAPGTDLERLGLFSSLWAYARALSVHDRPRLSDSPFQPLSATPFSDPHAQPPPSRPAQAANGLPNVVLVQSEAFFDPRPWCPDIASTVLPALDALSSEGGRQGQLEVPAWGANTVRTECAVLTGLTPEQWGIRQFNPYNTLARHACPSLASAFKAHGYRTVCVHPYPASFYRRHQVMPRLGFDAFIDIQGFDPQDTRGQYISDDALARQIGHLLDDQDPRPLFVFAISMENHGPLHLEAPTRAMASAALPKAPWPLAPHQRDLAVYLHHLQGADQMLSHLATRLKAGKRPGVLGWYGDHVPILPQAYAHYGPPLGSTPFLLWSSQASTPPLDKQARLLAHDVGPLVFQFATQGEHIKAPRNVNLDGIGLT